MSNAAKNVTELSPEERAALIKRLKSRKAAEASETKAPVAHTIARRARTTHAPLSFAQQRLWFIEQLEPNAPYKVPAMFRLAGPLNVGALEQSLNELVSRHEALRTTFDVIEGSPVQVIRPQLTLTLPVTDLRQLTPEEQASHLRRLRERTYEQPFDFVRGPLVSAELVRLAEEEHVLLFLMHHIVSDGWSIGIILKELCDSYEAFAAGRRPSLPELPIQYRDFAAWQREYLSAEVLERQLEYWKRCLGDNLPVLELPTDRPRPPVQSHRGAFRTRLLSRSLTERLKELARGEGVTLYMLLLSAFYTLLYRYTGQEDIVVGTPIANRNRAEIEPLIGFFVNTLVLRTDLSGDPPFRELLERVRHVTLGAYSHQDLPFEKLVEELQPSRDTSRTPLFQVMFSLQNSPLPVGETTGLKVSLLEDDTIYSLFDLSLDITERSDGLLCGLEYNTDLFENATAERALSHFAVLLEGVARTPGARLSELPLLTEEERQRLLYEWNDTRRDFPRERCVHELFEAQAARTPDAPALVADGERLTFAELDERANRLAQSLSRAGVGPECRVGVLLGRGVRAGVALLGVLKAGGAYVALDATYPPLRLSYMLKDAGARVLLTERRFAEMFQQTGVELLLMDDERPEPSPPCKESLTGRSVPESLAYVVYTSGTTGRPKGVLVSHRSLVNTSLAFVAHHRLTKRDRLLQFASLSFDVSSEEFFAAWLSGACAVMRPEHAFESVEGYARFVEREGVTLVNLPASFWAEWVAALEERAEGGAESDADAPASLLPSTLRRVVVGNEKSLSVTLERWQRLVGGRVEWSNAYGPTEATVTASNYEPDTPAHGDESLHARAASVPIGRPIINAELHVLDAACRLVPMGVLGELYVGGEGLARGYHAQPALTAERFVPNPYSLRGGERLYRTGDLARRLADGQVEFCGRADEQVKVRGFRVEVGDIESTLRQHPEVRESIVAALEDGRGGSRLVAYFVARGEADPDDLRGFLKERLPEYMIPAAFVRLEELPLTPNGKLDRKRLPDPFAGGVPQETYVEPRSELERTIAGVWQEVLKVERVGVHDNFFNLGGHSLLLLHVNSRLRAALMSELPVIEMFKYPTVSALAEHLSGARDEAQSPGPEARRSAAERASLLGRRRELRRRAAQAYEATTAEND